MKYIDWVKRGMDLKNIQELNDFISELEDGIIFGIYDHEDRFIGLLNIRLSEKILKLS